MPTVEQQAALDYLLTIFKSRRQVTPTFSIISDHAGVQTWNRWQIKPDALLIQINLPGFSPIELRARNPMRPQFPQLKSYPEADVSASTFQPKGKAASNMDVALWLDTYPNAIAGTTFAREPRAAAPNRVASYGPAMARNSALLASPPYPSKPLLSYFEPDGQLSALCAYERFARSSDWSVKQKMDLYDASARAFDPAVPRDLALNVFGEIYATLAGEWQVFRPHSPSVCSSAADIFGIITKEFSQFSWKGAVTLPNFTRRDVLEPLLSSLVKMRGVKPKAEFPVMTVSKFLHFYNPALFPIYDQAVIKDRVFRRFRRDFYDFCAISNIPYGVNESAVFLMNYVGWGSHLMAAAHSRFMQTFVDWLGVQPGGDLRDRRFDASTLYATAFEFTVIGAAIGEGF